VRWNAAKAFLKPIRQRPNLTVLTGVEVDRVLLDNGRASRWSVAGTAQVSWKARQEIILCAGSVGSPGILQRSGIGPPSCSKGWASACARTARRRRQPAGPPATAADLQAGKRPHLNQIAGLWGKMGMGLRYLYDRSGPLSMAPSQLGAFARSGGTDLGQPEYHVQPLSLERFGEPLHAFPAFTASVCDLRPQSRGRIDIRSANPADAPR
jgi:choline dehydrogenase